MKDEFENEIHASHEEVLGNVQNNASNVLEVVRKFISKPVIGDYLKQLPVACYTPREANKNTDNKISYPSNPRSANDEGANGGFLGSVGSAIGAIHIPTLITATALSLSFSYLYFQKKA